MLLLTTTAREWAWRLLKISSSLIGWFLGFSPIFGVSPWRAPLRRRTLYVHAHRRSLHRYIEQMSFRLRNSYSRMARTILIDCEGLESEKKKKKHARPLEIHEVWRSRGADVFFSHSPVGRKILFSKLVCTWRSNCSRGPFEEMWCADIEKWAADLAVEGLLFVKVSTKLDIHSCSLAQPLACWPGQRSIRPIEHSTREVQQNQTSKGLIVLGKDASVGWFVNGYVRLLQSQYESKSARTVLKIISQNLADYF